VPVAAAVVEPEPVPVAAPVVEPVPEPVPVAPKRAALLFGINYLHCSAGSRLNGCINDVRDITACLVDAGKFSPDEIVKFTDDTSVGYLGSTVEGMKSALTKLAARTVAEDLDLVYVHYSGHGSQVQDRNGDEADGFDEVILPSNFETAGHIADDWLRQWSLSCNPRTRLVVVFDCCNSGTALDLVVDDKHDVVFMSGCTDPQTSADAYNINNTFEYSGAMTSCLIAALKANPARWSDSRALRDAATALLVAKGFTQRPVLTTSKVGVVPFI
jgi:hypothetical protein